MAITGISNTNRHDIFSHMNILDELYILYCNDLTGSEGIIGSQLVVYDVCQPEIVRKAEVCFTYCTEQIIRTLWLKLVKIDFMFDQLA